VIWRGSR